MNDLITLGHGSGGKLSQKLIREVFMNSFGMHDPLTDSAVLDFSGDILAFTADSYVVDPIFFPGGDIGRMAICGTVNDLAVSGADPKYISASFIIEEGFGLSDLVRIADSMADAASEAGVKIVTGDTKVVEKGKCDRIFITTSGAGIMDSKWKHISTAGKMNHGDILIINGTLGNHALAVLGARTDTGFSIPVESDCVPLNHLIKNVLDRSDGVRFMRDLTRGGLAAALNELVAMTGSGISISEHEIPLDEPVRGLCEMLGFDPYYLANEGKIIMVVRREDAENVLEIMKENDLGKKAAIIGEITGDKSRMVILNTSSGGKRFLDVPSGLQLPRIC